MEPRSLVLGVVGIEPEIVYEDSNIAVINKPAGLQVHAARVAVKKKMHGEKRAKPQGPTLVDWLLRNVPEVKTVGDDPALRPGIVHRLDKDTSGVMVVAKTQNAFDYLKSLFQEHEVKKTYLAIVAGIPKARRGTINAPIGIRSGTLKRSVRSSKMAKPAVTVYRLLKTLKPDEGGARKFSLLEAKPETGRTHQIRVHLASIGHPVAGDRLYGPRAQPPWAKRLMLHALSLEFAAADGKRMKFEAEPPEAFSAVIHR